jgi:hypothetical protein
MSEGGVSRCNTEGDAEGEILFPESNFTVVHDVSEREGVGILFEIKEVNVRCGGVLRVKIADSSGKTVLGLLLPVGTILWTGLEMVVHCRFPVEPEETRYWTSLSSSQLSAKLALNVSGVLKHACIEINPKGTERLDVSTMIELMQ